MTVPKLLRSCAIALLACSLPCSPARAAWDADGNRVSFSAGQVLEYAAIPFGDGGVLVIWTHDDPAQRDDGDIDAQALDADGNVMAGWPAHGRVLANAPGAQRYPGAIPDAAGGAYVTWQDSPSHFRILRLTETGATAPGWPATGIDIAGWALEGRLPLVPDGAGGAYLAWGESVAPPENPALRLLRLGPDGTAAAGWPAGGVALGTANLEWTLAPDGEGGVYVGWAVPYLEGGPKITVRRLTSAGVPHPAWPAGGADVGAVDFTWADRNPVLVPDGSGGLYVAWWQLQVLCPMAAQCPMCGCASIQYATHLDGTGAVVAGWRVPGTVLGPLGVVSADARGGLLVATISAKSGRGETDVRGLVARVGPDGSPAPGWSLPGNPVCSESRQQTLPPALAADGAGGTFASWIDYRTAQAVLYLSRLTPSGSIADGWPLTGSIGSEAAVAPSAPALVPGRAGEAIAVWLDSRSGSPALYAERARPGPAGPPAPLSVCEECPAGLAVTGIRPNPARRAFWAGVSVPPTGEATLELLDLAGRVLDSRTIQGGRAGAVLMNASGNLKAGVYWVRLRPSPGAGLRTSVARVALVP